MDHYRRTRLLCKDLAAVIWALVGIFQHEQPVNKVWMLQDDQILTLSRYSDEESQLRYWQTNAEKEAVESIAARIERIAARKIPEDILETAPLTVAEFSNK